MRRLTAVTLPVMATLLAMTASAQMTGAIAESGCTALISDNRAVGGELYVMKTHNPGAGPGEHRDWLFDLSAKGGFATPLSDVGGPSWSVVDNFHAHTVDPEQLFAILTYPGGWMAIDSADVRATVSLGVVQRQKVGDSPPVGTLAGIGLVLPGDASTYTAGIIDRGTGAQATFPYGTLSGITIAFAPIVGVNNTDLNGSGCTLGGEILDPESGFGLISGYNVFRVAGVPAIVPTPADFFGNWQYYIPYNTFDTSIPDTAGTAGPDRNGDTLPDGDGTAAPNDGRPFDLAGLQNPDGLPYTGDEVLLFADVPFNPDGTPRISGTPPSAGTGYWYAVQPVVYQGATTLQDYDGLGFSDSDVFVGTNALDTDADGIMDSLDLDLDGSIDFYCPQVVLGENGLGLTTGGLPLLSSPVFGQINPAASFGEARLAGTIIGREIHLTLIPGFETGSIHGYNICRVGPGGTRDSVVNSGLILAQGGEGNIYTVADVLPLHERRLTRPRMSYDIEIVWNGGLAPSMVGPFVIEGSSATVKRRGR